MATELNIRKAQQLVEQGLEAVMQSDLKKARAKFKASVRKYATADGLTYWGWMEHQLGNTSLAIMLCFKATKVDPEFGNAYNDIGSYLIAMGKLDEAIPWLQKATTAVRYEPRQFPHMNLGRIYLAKNLPLLALEQFGKALEYSPKNEELQKLIQTVQQSYH